MCIRDRSTRTSSAPSVSTRSRSPASRSAWDSSGSRCSVTAFPRSASSSRTTSASSSSSEPPGGSTVKKFLLGFLALLVIADTVFIVPTWWGQPWSIDHLYTRVFVKYVLKHPQLITQLGLPLPFGRDRLDDYSPASEDADLA